MSIHRSLWLLVCSCTVRLCLASDNCANDGDSHSFVQVNMELTARGSNHSAKLGNALLSHDSKMDLQMSVEQILAELKSAKRIRQQYDEHIAKLEDLLATSRAGVNDAFRQRSEAEASTSTKLLLALPQQRRAETLKSGITHSRTSQLVILVILLFFWCVWVGFAIRSIINYEKTRDQYQEPWYLQNKCMAKVLIGVAGYWFWIGLFFFTLVFRFHGEEDFLDVPDVLFICVQIITTVGFGDLTPASDAGKLFMAIYVAAGVVGMGSIAHELISAYLDKKEEKLNMRSSTATWLEISFCLAFGTLFFGMFPGENKDYHESFYMSVISFCTVGFGAYHPITTVGKLVGCVWMIISVVVAARAIADFAQFLFQYRRGIRSKSAAIYFFRELAKEQKGSIDRAQFLGFELVRDGMEQSSLDSANAIFDRFDVSSNGKLEFREFEAYVNSMYF